MSATAPGRTGTVLDQIVRDVQSRLETGVEARDASDVAIAAAPAPRSLVRALTAGGSRGALAVIAEVKRRSPSVGAIDTAADPAAIATRYVDAGAAAVSVLTEPDHFGGSLDDLRDVRRAGVAAPLLRKDFVVDDVQVRSARAAGADSVLLIAALHADVELLRHRVELAADLGMDALVEVHDERELDRALAAGARVVGVNNRDLRTFTVDLTVTERLAALVPSGVVLVGESGVRGVDDARRLALAGCDAVLVGELLMRARDGGAVVRDLRRVSTSPRVARTRTKLCGLRSPEDVVAACVAGADEIGVVLVPGARRAVEVVDVPALVTAARTAGGHVRVVAVVGDELPDGSAVDDFDALTQLLDVTGVDVVQLAGRDPSRAARAARIARGAGVSVVRSVGVGARDDLDDLEALVTAVELAGDRVLLDAADGGARARAVGGGGHRVATATLDHLLGGPSTRRGIAGGLDATNVGALVQRFRPAVVDVSSGIEDGAGRNDASRMTAFVDAVRRADAATDEPGDALAGFRLDAQPMPPDGSFGQYGGQWIPEVLVPAASRIAAAWRDARRDAAFGREYAHLCRSFVGRPTPLQDAHRLTAHAGGARVLLKREDLAHTGAHKINNALGQALLARRLGARRVIAETGAGQHGVATATACALLDLPCVVYMGAHDIERQYPNVLRMELLGAEVRPVEEGARTLTDAVSAAIRDWVVDPDGTYYLIGSAVGMHPFPTMVRDLQCVIGHEARAQTLELLGELPSAVVACVGGGSNAIGTFVPFVGDGGVELHGAEAGGDGVDTGRHAASIVGGRDGVLHGARTRLLQDTDGQVAPTHSISAGLDYPGVGPEHAHLAGSGRAQYHSITDEEALDALRLTCRQEGIIPAIESAHAIALALRLAAGRPASDSVVVTVSGRGDKDLATIAARSGEHGEGGS